MPVNSSKKPKPKPFALHACLTGPSLDTWEDDDVGVVSLRSRDRKIQERVSLGRTKLKTDWEERAKRR
jgi:hypothetical protein